MSLIWAGEVAKDYGAGYIFENMTVSLDPDDRVGLVGPNGGGKTTLIRLLAGLEEPTKGTFQRKKGLRIGYLPQDPPAAGDKTLWQSLLDVFAELRDIEAQLRTLADELAKPNAGPEVLARYGQLQHEFEARGGYDYHTRIETILGGLSFTPQQYAQPLAQLSGGQRSRAMLAGLLLSEPELLLLDEPTNHLDLDALEWLEDWLDSFKGAILAVSHDRYFLDRIATKMWEISSKRLETYRGNYSAFALQREERLANRLKQYQAQQEYIERTESFIRRNVGAKRVDVAQGRKTRLERFKRDEAIERPENIGQIHLRFAQTPRSGDLVFKFEHPSIGYVPKKPLVSLPDLTITRGERVAIIGPNGTGKTTLLRTMLGQLPPLSGKVQAGASIRFGYLGQTHDDLVGDQTAIESVLSAEPALSHEQARSLLGKMLISGDEARKRIDQLSGGQRSRVVLARLMAQKANVLVLDEPTNHLDISSQEVLEGVLKEFAGTVIFVSHDRYLVRALGGRIWVIEQDKLHAAVGGWEGFSRWRRERLSAAQAARSQTQGHQAKQSKKAHRQNRQQTNQVQRLERRQAELEKQIRQLEHRLQELGHQISAAGEQGQVEQVHELGRQYQEADGQLKGVWNEWTQVTAELEKQNNE